MSASLLKSSPVINLTCVHSAELLRCGQMKMTAIVLIFSLTVVLTVSLISVLTGYGTVLLLGFWASVFLVGIGVSVCEYWFEQQDRTGTTKSASSNRPACDVLLSPPRRASYDRRASYETTRPHSKFISQSGSNVVKMDVRR